VGRVNLGGSPFRRVIILTNSRAYEMTAADEQIGLGLAFFGSMRSFVIRVIVRSWLALPSNSTTVRGDQWSFVHFHMLELNARIAVLNEHLTLVGESRTVVSDTVAADCFNSSPEKPG